MAEAKRDPNHVTTALAVDDTTGTTENILIDSASGRVMIELTVGGNDTSYTSPARRDQNHIPVVMGVDDVTGELREIATDNDGRIIVEFG